MHGLRLFTPVLKCDLFTRSHFSIAISIPYKNAVIELTCRNFSVNQHEFPNNLDIYRTRKCNLVVINEKLLNPCCYVNDRIRR